MRTFTSKIRPLIILFIFFSLIWANFNVIYFAHSHIDENGQLIVHAHPYHKDSQKNHNAPNHTHSKSELTLLGLIYQILSFFALYLLFFIFLSNFNPMIKILFSFQSNPVEIFSKSILRRGPPSMLRFA